MSSVIDKVTKTVKDNYNDMSRGGQVVKKVILASNALVMLFGLLLIIVGGIAAGGQFSALTSTTLASGIIVIGVFVMLIAILGCWGAMTENKVLLYIYFGLLLFFAVIQFAVGIAAYVKKDDLPEVANALWSAAYDTDRKSIDDIEKSFQCCGWYNVSDRAVPPTGNEVKCSTIPANEGKPACSTHKYQTLGIKYGDKNDYEARVALMNYQIDNNCCGWTEATMPDGSYWVPFNPNMTDQTCVSETLKTMPCRLHFQQLWYNAYYSSTPAGDAYIVQQQAEFPVDPSDTTSCCGWETVVDAAIPPYTNNTCVLTKGFTSPCSTAVNVALSNSLQITGGVGIALGVLQIATIILTLVLIVKIPPGGSASRRNEDANAGVMEELHDEE